MARLDDTLKAETVDRMWAGKVSEQVNEAVRGLNGRVAITDLQCGSLMCRAKLAHKDSENAQADLNDLTPKPPFNTSGFVVPNM
jgi:hypothetical protein